MSSVSCGSSSIEISPESEIVNDDRNNPTSSLLSSPSLSRELNSPKSFEDIHSIGDEDSYDVEEFYAKSECKSSQTEWPTVKQNTVIQINGSLVIVTPEIKRGLLQEKQTEDLETFDKNTLVMTSAEQNSNLSILRKNSMTSVVEKLARSGVTITCNKSYKKRCSYHPTMKMKNIYSCSERYNPLLPSTTSYPNISINKNLCKYQTAGSRLQETNEVEMQTKRFCDRPKTSKKFVCNFCDRLFKSLECLQSHYEIHDISYWIKPFLWMEEEKLSHNRNQKETSDDICFFGTLENQESSNEEGFTCQVCDMIFASPEGLSKHMDVHRTPHKKTYVEDRQESISEEGYAMIDLTGNFLKFSIYAH
ncbi:unnamed protein product [Nezara viridula]|uniref:C2H2-type domain-containing protein n=1 Tax=Nezara viridula TaxID=85310 RepID=A0A9P0MMV6_NEZVI|nr:unnamed protein product [Nezara viridula]